MKKEKISEKLFKKPIETFKTSLIVILSVTLCILLYNFIKTQGYNGNVFFVSSHVDTQTVSESEDIINLYFEYTNPEYVAVKHGGAREVFYSDSNSYILAQNIINEVTKGIFSSDAEVIPTEGADAFKNLLDKDSLYVSYPYKRFPKLITQFINGYTDKLSSHISSYRKLILVPGKNENDKISVYIKDENSDFTVKVITNLSSSSLIKFINSVNLQDKKNWQFAYELNLDKVPSQDVILSAPVLSWDILIPTKNIVKPDVYVYVPDIFKKSPGSNDSLELVQTVLGAFGMNQNLLRQYIDKDNTLVCVDESATIKIHPDGVIEYSSIDSKSGMNLTGGTKLSSENTYFLSFTGISRIINTLLPLSQNNEISFKLRLQQLQSESIEVAEYKFMFDYYIEGARIVSSPYHAIDATSVDGKLTSMRIDLKRFDLSHDESVIEPLFSSIDKFYSEKNSGSKVVVQKCIPVYNISKNINPSKVSWFVN